MPVVDRMVRVDLRTVTLDDPAAGRDHARQRPGARRRGRLLPRDRRRRVGRRHRGLSCARPRRSPRRRCARCSARPSSTRCSPSASGSTRTCSGSSTSRPSRGAIKVTTVEIKDVGIPQGMQRAMARQAEAERERRAKVINAEGEFQAAARLAEAADVISPQPGGAAAALPADAGRDRQGRRLDRPAAAAARRDPDRRARRDAGQRGGVADGAGGGFGLGLPASLWTSSSTRASSSSPATASPSRPGSPATTVEQAVAAADEIGYPCVDQGAGADRRPRQGRRHQGREGPRPRPRRTPRRSSAWTSAASPSTRCGSRPRRTSPPSTTRRSSSTARPSARW